MTFLIEPGMALSQPSTKPEHAGSNPPGSGDTFARSLEEDRSKAKNEGEIQTTAKSKVANLEEKAPRLPWLQNDHGEANVDSEATMFTESALPSGEESTNAIVAEDTEITEVLGEHIEQAEIDNSTATEDDDEIPLAVPAATPSDTNEMSVAAEAASDENPGTHIVADAGQNTDTARNNPLPASGVQGLMVQATVQGEMGQPARSSGKDARITDPVSASAASAMASDAPDKNIQHAAISPQAESADRLSRKAELVEHNDGLLAKLGDADSEAISVTGTSGTLTHANPAPDSSSQILASAMGTPPVSQPAAQPVQSQIHMTPTHAVVTASPAETVKIITDTVSAPDSAPDRITVQLDPPELGRVSIDFKFDAHGLQHITVTGESPEALRQLRLMHFELTQALERSGMSGQSMTFQQQQSGQQQTQTPASGRVFDENSLAAETSLLSTANISAESIRPARSASGGIDIRL